MKKLFLTLLVVISMMTGCNSTSSDKTNDVQDTPEVQEVQIRQEVEVPTDAVNEQDTKQDKLTEPEQSEPEQNEPEQDEAERNDPEENTTDHNVTGADNDTASTQGNAGTSTVNSSNSGSSSMGNDNTSNSADSSSTETNQSQTSTDVESPSLDVAPPSGILPGEMHPDGHREGTLSTDESVKDWVESTSNAGISNLHKLMEDCGQDLKDAGLIPEDSTGVDPEALQKLREEGFAAVGKND